MLQTSFLACGPVSIHIAGVISVWNSRAVWKTPTARPLIKRQSDNNTRTTYLKIKLAQVDDHWTEKILGINLVCHLGNSIRVWLSVTFTRKKSLDDRQLARDIFIDLCWQSCQWYSRVVCRAATWFCNSNTLYGSPKGMEAPECNYLTISQHLTFLLPSPVGALSRRVMLSLRPLTVSAGVRVFCRLKKFIVELVWYV